ncbi:hypothetical protein ONZ45_g6323 [Pleurotus djamor]|nr:hypothetical protein ONZ45_g6323 [Pleurotus djamor]
MQFSMKFAVFAFLAQVALINAMPADSDDGYDNGLVARGPRQRPTQQECEVACTLAGAQGPAWTDCVNRCMASNYPSPPPSPHNRAPKRKGTNGGIGKPAPKKTGPKKTGPKRKTAPKKKSKPRAVEDEFENLY